MGGIAIVTGSDSGIGKATAVRLARAGFDVGITYHTDRAGAEGTAGEVRDAGVNADLQRLDLEDPTSAVKCIDALTDALGGIDVLVNNAGTNPGGPFLDLPLAQWQEVIDVNLTGAFLCGQRAAQRMVEQGRGGRIVNVTSVHEHVPLPNSAAYCAAKGGLGLLTKSMALELAPHGITVNAVAPGEVSTPMTGQHDTDPATQERPGIPLARPAHAGEVAEVIAFVASGRASYVTGASLVVDGGLLLMAAVRSR